MAMVGLALATTEGLGYNTSPEGIMRAMRLVLKYPTIRAQKN
jgi:hypothetical protein